MFFRKILLFTFLIPALLDAQSPTETIIAEAGDLIITETEFKLRYELAPQLSREVKGRELENKYEFLYTLLAEKLWALQARKIGLDTTDIMRYTFRAIEKMYVRDALYMDEIQSGVKITPAELEEARYRNKYPAVVSYIFSHQRDEIFNIYEALKSGLSFDTLMSVRPEALYGYNYQVNFGKMEKYAEDSIYSLKMGAFSSPIESEDGWYIFRLDSLKEKLIHDSKALTTENKNIEKVLSQRQIDSLYKEFFNKFFRGRKVNTNGIIFWSFADKVIDILKSRKTEKSLPDNEFVYTEAGDYYRLADAFGGDSLRMSFIEFDDVPVSLNNFLYDFIFEGFYSKSVNPDTIRAKLNSRVKTFIEHELLAREGFERGYDKKPEIQAALDIWRNYYLSGIYGQKLFDESKVTEAEVFAKYENNTTGFANIQVNIQEILSDSLEIIDKILREIDKGTDFGELARKYTQRVWTREKGGEFGFFPASMYGEIGEAALKMRPGEIYGPIKTDDGYSVIKLLEKKEELLRTDVPFEKVKTEIARKVFSEKLVNAKLGKTAEFAKEFGIKINGKALEDLKVTGLNMIVYKYFGFGGRNVAVPVTPMFFEWYEKYLELKNELP